MNQRNNAKMIWSIVIVNCLLYGAILIDTVIDTHLFQNHDNALAISMFARNLVLSVIAIVLYKTLLRDDFKSTGLRPFLKQWGISFATAILLQIITGYLYSQLSGTAGTENQAVLNTASSVSPVLMFITVVITGPIVEETIFRLLLQNWVRKQFQSRAGLYSVLISSSIFALWHSGFSLEFIAYIGVSLLLGTTYEKTKNFALVICIHIGINLFAQVLTVL